MFTLLLFASHFFLKNTEITACKLPPSQYTMKYLNCVLRYFSEKIQSCGGKHVPILCLQFLGVFPKIPSSIFTYQKSSRIFRESLCRPLSGVRDIDFFLQYSSNTPKYNMFDPYWMQNNLFYIPFCMHNNLNITIKIITAFFLYFRSIVLAS